MDDGYRKCLSARTQQNIPQYQNFQNSEKANKTKYNIDKQQYSDNKRNPTHKQNNRSINNPRSTQTDNQSFVRTASDKKINVNHYYNKQKIKEKLQENVQALKKQTSSENNSQVANKIQIKHKRHKSENIVEHYTTINLQNKIMIQHNTLLSDRILSNKQIDLKDNRNVNTIDSIPEEAQTPSPAFHVDKYLKYKNEQELNIDQYKVIKTKARSNTIIGTPICKHKRQNNNALNKTFSILSDSYSNQPSISPQTERSYLEQKRLVKNKSTNSISYNSNVPNKEYYFGNVQSKSISPYGKVNKQENHKRTQSTFDTDFLSLDCEEKVLMENNEVISNINSSPEQIIKKEEKKSDDIYNHMQQQLQQSLDIQSSIKKFPEENKAFSTDSEALNEMAEKEKYYLADPFYEQNQKHISWQMRAILLDWLMEVSMEFQLKRESYHITVNIIDRYLSLVIHIPKNKLQLIGVTSLYIASKLEEIYPPKIQDFVKSSDNCYTTQEIREMEIFILKTVKWKITPPTTNMWINWYLVQWDIYIDRANKYLKHPLVTQNE